VTRHRDCSAKPPAGLKRLARALLLVGCLCTALGFLVLVFFVLTAFMYMDNPGGTDPFETAIKALFAFGLGSLLVGGVLSLEARTPPSGE
jgi:hypothetical protein